jgi:hypothetical protein
MGSGGGGGGANVGNPGSPGSAGTGNSGSAGSPSTSPGVSITPATSYPITVGPGGFITISWNTQ